MTYGDFKDLPRRTTCDRVFRDKAYDIAKNSKYDWHQRGLASIFYKFFDKKLSSGENMLNQVLAGELQKIKY